MWQRSPGTETGMAPLWSRISVWLGACMLLLSFAFALVSTGAKVGGAEPYPRRATLPLVAADGATGGMGSFDCPELDSFAFGNALARAPSTLSAWIQSLDPATGIAVVSGNDSMQPTQPFHFDWGDGTSASGFFPTSHAYADRQHNHTIRVTANYPDGGTGTFELIAWFAAPSIQPMVLNPFTGVTIPPVLPSPLATRLYPVPGNLSAFPASAFAVVPRTTVEYVLSVAAQLQYGYANSNVFVIDGGFKQLVLANPLQPAGGMYSLWFLSPPVLAVAGESVQLLSAISSVFHEMGHNITLNTPAGYYFGGKTDGLANAIYSETMAQIFQHATVYDVVRDGGLYGLGCAMRTEIRNSGLASLGILRYGYAQYLSGGHQFTSWNNPATPLDETVGTFMTLAYKFMEHADAAGEGFGPPLKRMMAFLQTWDSNLHARFDPQHNSAAADTFRATFMVTALSRAFDEDLRAEFTALGFPVDDATFSELMAR